MRASRVVGVLFVLAILVGLSLIAATARADDSEADWVAVLAGKNEVPARDTHARGVALFFLNDDGTVSYQLNVANIYNPVAAHIHCGAADVAGPVGVTLFHGDPGSGRFDGVLATGTFSAPDSGNGCGWTTLAQVVAAVGAGNAYVNVHTNDGADGVNTGPGDFPGGEIRGQLMVTD